MALQQKKSTGIISALMHEYRIAIDDFKQHLSGITPQQLTTIVDKHTANKDCTSVQAICTHVVYCGYNYITMMDIHLGNENSPWPERQYLNTVEEYNQALDTLLEKNIAFFENVANSQMQQYEPEQKLTTFWGQLYDFEQLMEHAIIHLYRHRRQIVEFKKQLV